MVAILSYISNAYLSLFVRGGRAAPTYMRNVLLIKLFDKRRGDAYSNMNIIRFLHYTSALTRVSKLDIVRERE